MKIPQSIAELNERASRPTPQAIETLRSVDGSVLVLGAGGKMGFHLSLMLRRGLDACGSRAAVIAVSRFRNAATRTEFHQQGIQTIAADLLEPEALDALPDADTVFFLAGVKFGTSDDPEMLRRVNVELPHQVGRRYGNARIIALSTGCVYPFVPVESSGSRETDTPEPCGAYAESCLGRERALSESNAPLALIRLNYSVDLRYGVLVDVARGVHQKRPINLSTPCANVIWQGDSNAYIISSLAHVSAPAFVLNVTGAQTVWIRQVAEQFAERFGVAANFEGAPGGTAWLSDARLCHRLFGSPVVDEATLIEWVADWVARGGESLDKPTHFETRDGRF